MKGFKQVIFAAFCIACSFAGFVVVANEYDFYETITVTDPEVASKKLEEQLANAEKFNADLGECTYLEFSGEIISHKENLDEVTVETDEEKNEVVNKYQGEGYTTSVSVTYDEASKSSYEFITLNGKVVSTTINNEKTTKYDEQSIEGVLSTITSTDTEDYKIVVAQTVDKTPISEAETKKLESDAMALVESLQKQGYKASYVQNNKETTDETITSSVELTQEQIKENLQNKSTDKEIKDVVINKTTEPNTYTFENYENETSANNKKTELENTGIYESVATVEKANPDKEKATAVTDKTGVLASDQTIIDGTVEEVYENNKLVGYKEFYKSDVLVTEAVDDKVLEDNFTSDTLCNAAKANYPGYTDLRCTKTDETTVESSTNNTINFNDTQQSERRWSHLDISVAQAITIVDENGKAVDTVEGTLSNVLGYINKGTSREKTLKYPTRATTDGGRLEFKTTDATVRNTDLVTITATVSYEYNGVDYSRNVTLVGYLNNAMNVCSQRYQYGGGFDLEFSVSFTEDGKPILKIDTDEKWTLTGDMAAVYEPKVFYNEYEYSKLYDVVAKDTDYIYEVSFIETDYTVSYEGESAVYNLTEEMIDKNFVIEGERTTYTVTTVGVIKEKELCGTGDVGEPGEGFEDGENKEEENNTEDENENQDQDENNNVAEENNPNDENKPSEDVGNKDEEITPPHTGIESTGIKVPFSFSTHFVTTIDDKKKIRK